MPSLLRDLLFTPSCINCSQFGIAICQTCINQVKPELRTNIVDLDFVKCAGSYSGWLRELLIQYKSGKHELGRGLAELILTQCYDQLKGCQLVPIPTSRAKIAQRQIDLVNHLAKQIAVFEKSIKVRQVLFLTKTIPDQVGLSAAQRSKNLQNAFASRYQVSGSVVILDDVVTTGSTISSAAKALRNAGATSVAGIGLCAATKLH